MKTKLHFPVEQYGFVEVEMEVESVQEALQAYSEAKKAPIGLEPKEWNTALDRYLKEGTMDSNAYQAMGEAQKGVCQEIKKSLKRIEANKE